MQRIPLIQTMERRSGELWNKLHLQALFKFNNFFVLSFVASCLLLFLPCENAVSLSCPKPMEPSESQSIRLDSKIIWVFRLNSAATGSLTWDHITNTTNNILSVRKSSVMGGCSTAHRQRVCSVPLSESLFFTCSLLIERT